MKAFKNITGCWSLVLATQLNGLCVSQQRAGRAGLGPTFRGGSSSELANRLIPHLSLKFFPGIHEAELTRPKLKCFKALINWQWAHLGREVRERVWEVMERISRKQDSSHAEINYCTPLSSRKMCLSFKSVSTKVISKDSLANTYRNILNKLKIPTGGNYFPLNSNLIGFLSLFPNDSADHRLLHILFL